MMDHAEATRRMAAEQYLLGEMNESDREEFEAHYFSCPECSESVEHGAVLLANARAVSREQVPASRMAPVPGWRKWFGLEWGFAPAAALAGCAVLLVLAGYQNLVQIPALRQGSASGDLALAPALSFRAARAAQDLTFRRQTGILSLTVVHEWEEPYTRYTAEVERTADHRVVSKTEIAATPSDLAVVLRTGRLEAGPYVLTIYGFGPGSGGPAPVARIPFTLTD